MTVGVSCVRGLRRALGVGSARYAATACSVSWFRPTRAQWDARARWFRCDVVLPGHDRLYSIPDRTPLIGTAALTTRTRICLSPRDRWPVSCRDAHACREVGTAAVAYTVYPSAAQWRTAAVRKCRRLVTSRSWAYRGPSHVGFRAGDEQITCFNRTTR